MGHKLAIDFGTTNTVVARWDDTRADAEIINIQSISADSTHHGLIPSVVYVHDGKTGKVTIGQAVHAAGLDQQRDNRLFRSFKRGIVASPAPDARQIDGVAWADRDVGRHFVQRVLEALPYATADLDQLVLTAPVASFEGYLAWLNELLADYAPDRVQIVDESTAAALGYAVTEPGAVVLVFDFGGGTLDLSLVQLPESREKTGGFLQRLMRSNANQQTAKVIAKAGRVIGGSDIDQWLLADVLTRNHYSTKDLGNNYASLLTACENAKIALSTVESTVIVFEAAGQAQSITVTRTELEGLLEKNGFFTALRHVVDKVMHVAHQRGIFKEDINYVLMVGGVSLMPSVQYTLKQYFTDTAVRSDKPFTAVAEGALRVAAGFGVEDYLAHSYGIRHLDPHTGQRQYDEIIAMGSRYPSEEPIEIILGAAHDQQTEIEFVIGEIDSDSVSMLEVKYEDGQAVFVAQADRNSQQIVALNEVQAAQMLARLIPAGRLDQDRLKAAFRIDERRQLRLTVTDLLSGKGLLEDVVVITLH